MPVLKILKETPSRLLSHCLGIERVILYRDNPGISDEMNAQIDALLKRRTGREPLQYILGYTEFYGLKIKVGTGVLIPRPETELLAEEAINTIANCKLQNVNCKILDLCTGSGCIALALAKAFPDAQVYGTDMSADALGYAGENAGVEQYKKYNLSERRFV